MARLHCGNHALGQAWRKGGHLLWSFNLSSLSHPQLGPVARTCGVTASVLAKGARSGAQRPSGAPHTLSQHPRVSHGQLRLGEQQLCGVGHVEDMGVAPSAALAPFYAG